MRQEIRSRVSWTMCLVCQAVGLLLTVSIALTSGIAHAHLGSTSFLTVNAEGDTFELEYDVSEVDLQEELPELSVLEPHAMNTWAQAGLSLNEDGAPIELEWCGATTLQRRDEAYRRLRFRFTAEPDAPIEIAIEHLYDSDPQHETVVVYEGQTHILRRGEQSMRLEQRDFGEIAWTFLVEGVLHFAWGFDHVLFLLALMLGTLGFRTSRTSERNDEHATATNSTPGRRGALRRLLWLSLAFTAGHSVTLIAATLDWFALPIGLVEFVIAGSVLLVALSTLLRLSREASSNESRVHLPIVAFLFGLIHGFGFSSVLVELGLPVRGRIFALLVFNVGLELAQLTFIFLSFLPLCQVLESRFRRPALLVTNVLIGGVAVLWMLERMDAVF